MTSEKEISKGSGEIYKAGYASIFGRPNVGKSTFLNQVLGFKLSIISPKPQTTRHRILGIHSAENAQIIFLDTPGLLKPRYQLQKAMMRAVEAAIEDADIIIYMIEADEILYHIDREHLLKFKEKNIPIFILLNKIDLVQKNKVLPLIEKISKEIKPDAIIPISALKNDGINDVIVEIVKRLPESPAYYPVDLLTEHPERFIVSEIIREKIFYHFGEEIPYSTTVVIDDYKERKGRKVLIRATIVAERESQKGILIGKNGAALKKIGALARVDIEKFIQRSVYLELWVKVKEKWRKNEDALREFGYGSKLPRG